MRRKLKAGGEHAEPVWSLGDPPEATKPLRLRRRPRLKVGRAILTGLLGGASVFASLAATHFLLPYLDDPDALADVVLTELSERSWFAEDGPPALPVRLEPDAPAGAKSCQAVIGRGNASFHRPPGSC